MPLSFPAVGLLDALQVVQKLVRRQGRAEFYCAIDEVWLILWADRTAGVKGRLSLQCGFRYARQLHHGPGELRCGSLQVAAQADIGQYRHGWGGLLTGLRLRRSEERRVGKEWRWWASAAQE